MISISKCTTSKTQLLLRYCIKLSKSDFKKPTLKENSNYRSIHHLCPKSSCNFRRQVESNYISVGRIFISTKNVTGPDDFSDIALSLNNQLFNCIRVSDIEGAFKCLQDMLSNHVPVRCHYFWPLILQMKLKHGEQGVLDVLDRMISLELSIDYETCAHYLCPNLNLKNPLLVIRKLQDRNMKMPQILTPICISLLQSNQINEVLNLCFEKFPHIKLTHADFISALVEYYINTSDVENTVKLLKRANNIEQSGDLFLTNISQSKNPLLEVEKVQVIITDFIKAGIEFSSSGVYDVKVFFTKHGLTTSNFLFYQKTTRRRPPRLDVDRPLPSIGEMSTSELEHRLISARSRNLDPRNVLKRLFLKYCQEKKYDRAREVKEELQECQVPFTLGMQSTCIDLHIHYREPEEAESILSNLRQTRSSFQVDEYKIVDLARVYAEQGQYEKALQLVSSIDPRYNLNQKHLERNCKELLSSIQGEGVLLSMFKVLCETKLCAPTSTPILSTIIRYFLNRNNLPKAVSYFEKFAKTYRKTPLRHELLIACLSKQSEESSSLKAKDIAPQKTLENSSSQKTDESSIILSKKVNTLGLSQNKPETLTIVMDTSTRLHGEADTSIAYITALAELGRDATLKSFVKEELKVTPEFLTKMTKQIQRLADENKTQSLTLLRELFESDEKLVDPVYLALLRIYCRKDNDEEIRKLNSSYEKIKKPTDEFLTIVHSRLKTNSS